MSTYRVVLTGRMLPGHEPQQVRQAISEKFSLQEGSEHLRLMLAGKRLTVKAGVSQDEAQTYRQVLADAGLESDVQAEAAVEPETARPVVQGQFAAPASPSVATPEGGAFNPYQQPSADLDTPTGTEDFDLQEPRRLSAGSGWDWIREGFHYFKQRPVIWIGMIILFGAIFFGGSLVPGLSLVLNLMLPLFTGGLILASYKLYQGEDIGVGDLFAGFRKNAKGLMILGVLYGLAGVGFALVIGGAAFAIAGGQGLSKFAPASSGAAAPILQILLVILAVMVVWIPMMMAYYFAPALVVMHDLPALTAMNLSLKGCWRNALPFLVYGLASGILMIVAAIPFGLGMLVMLPVLMASTFAAYRQIYTLSPSP